MHIDKAKIGDVVYVTDYSYSVGPATLKPNFNYIPFAREKEPYTIIEKGKFPAHNWTLKKEKLFNNIKN